MGIITTIPPQGDGAAGPTPAETDALPVTTNSRYALSVLCEEGQTVEVRAKGRDGSVFSGYGQDIDELAQQVDLLDSTDTTGIYLTLNPVNPALMARRSRVGKVRSTDPLTADADIVRRRWLPVDLDPVRPAGVSSTEEEKAAAQKKAGLVIAYLTGLGWPAPVVADSGNGYHVLYRVDLPNDEHSRDLVKGCLEALAKRFSDTAVSVDVKNFNAARIWKVYGTVARKGEHTRDRPHRKSRILSVPDTLAVVPAELLEALAREVKAAGPAPTPARLKGKGRDFDLAAWLAEYEPNLPCKVIPKNKAGHRYFYALDPCPFAGGAHKDGAFLGQLADGAVYAKCHHNSCGNGNRWRELRALGDPEYAPHTDQKAGRKGRDQDVPEAKEEDTARILPFFEKDGRLYLDVIDTGGVFGFVYEHDGEIKFVSTVFDNGDAIKPAVLPIHHDTRETVFVVGVPRADLVKTVPLLPPVDIYARLDQHIKKYCDLPDKDRELCIYYCLYSWFYTKCPTSPYLRFLGDTGKGKSRLTEVISDLCFYPIKATGSSTTSGLMRFHERWRGTLVIDEGDLRGGADDPLVKFLNVGFERWRYIILSDTNDPTRQLIFHPYGPKVLAMREPFKDNATEGRCLSYSPYETHRKDIPPELSPEYHAEVAELRAIIARFVLHHWQAVDGNKMMEYGDLDIERRLLQMARPVSVVLQLFPDGQARFIEYLKHRQQEIKRTRSQSWEGSLFNHAYSLAVGDESVDGVIPEAITARDIAEAFRVKSGRVNNALRSIGFETEVDNISVTRKDGSTARKTIRKLVVPSHQVWREITRRYWFSEDGSKPPICPDTLRGSRWIDPQMKLPHPPSPSVTNVTSVTACNKPLSENGAQNKIVTNVTPSGVGVDKTPIQNINPPTSKSVTNVTENIEPISEKEVQNEVVTSVTVVTLPRAGGVFHNHPQNTEPQSPTPTPIPAKILEAAGLSYLPDPGIYSRIPNPEKAPGRCMWKGCNDRPMWGEGGRLQHPLCERHYLTIKNANAAPGEVPECTTPTGDQDHETRELQSVTITDFKLVNGVEKEPCYRCGEMAYCTHVEKLTDKNRVEREKRRPWFLCRKCAKELLDAARREIQEIKAPKDNRESAG